MIERTENDENSGLLSPQAREELLRLLLLSSGKRISSADLDGRRVWIKRYDAEPMPLAKRLHALVSPLSPLPFLRSSGTTDGGALVERELRKMRAFRAAGILVPTVLYRGDVAMVLTHVAEIVQDELRRLRQSDPAAHDRLLVETTVALARAHSAGLCHGRPHPRDMFVSDGRWGFVDFEEEPEAVMPLRIAQARDLWLLFMQISSWALLPDTEEQALSAYVEAGPAGVLTELAAIVGAVSPLLPPLALMEKVALGGDGRRLLKATRFLKAALGPKGVDFAKPSMDAAGLGATERVKEEP
jgi:tRNA A-37 threonylcarbamoyl transferase component Bud32